MTMVHFRTSTLTDMAASSMYTTVQLQLAAIFDKVELETSSLYYANSFAMLPLCPPALVFKVDKQILI